MKTTALILAGLVACAPVLAQDKSADFAKVFAELKMDKGLSDIGGPVNQETILDQVSKQLEASMGRKLTASERADLAKQTMVVDSNAKADPEVARKLFRDQMFRYLSPEDMKAAAALFATPQGRRIRFALAEAEMAVTVYVSEGTLPDNPVDDPALSLEALRDKTTADIRQGCKARLADPASVPAVKDARSAETICQCWLKATFDETRDAPSKEALAIVTRTIDDEIKSPWKESHQRLATCRASGAAH